jgi:hypothetical protein
LPKFLIRSGMPQLWNGQAWPFAAAAFRTMAAGATVVEHALGPREVDFRRSRGRIDLRQKHQKWKK